MAWPNRNHPCWWSETIPFSLFTQSHRTGACFRDLEMSGGSCLISPQPTKQNIPSFTLNPGNSPSLSLTSSPPFAGNIPPSAELLTWDPSQPVEPPPRAQNRVRRVWFWRGGRSPTKMVVSLLVSFQKPHQRGTLKKRTTTRKMEVEMRRFRTQIVDNNIDRVSNLCGFRTPYKMSVCQKSKQGDPKKMRVVPCLFLLKPS